MPHHGFNVTYGSPHHLDVALYNWIRGQLNANNWQAAVSLLGCPLPVPAHLPAGQWIVLPVVDQHAPGWAFSAWWDWMWSRVRSAAAQPAQPPVVLDAPELVPYPGQRGDAQQLAALLRSGSEFDMLTVKLTMMRDALAADSTAAGLKELVLDHIGDPAMVENFVALRVALSKKLIPGWLEYQIRHGEVAAALMMTECEDHVRSRGGGRR
jgi:hypothetical protein